ncbi:hypothetical protein GQ43DRAFT_157774 [Delitschia confertaspora ATCC 74209]|uniref:Uncharacterized protein n=1 Tax=Delitschia confertaspora ATCC 74209 TaxID=1513339 RepID=A0A9P4JHM5_9PLEO|nr:hypothetical protein GQ43DRAFT_157774 [Delitschia confertaspora ATCC 74209]
MDPPQRYVEQQPQNHSAGQKGKEPATLTSRIASSASRLAKDVIGPSSANDFSNSLSSATGLGSKLHNGSSSSSQSQWTGTLPSRPMGSGSGVFGTRHENASSESFRSSFAQGARDPEYEDFMRTSYPSLPELTRASPSPQSWTTEFQRPPQLNGFSGASIGYQSEYDDGAEVRMLLSDPSIDMSRDYVDFEMADPTEATADDLFGTELSPGEQKAAERIRSSLPAAPTHQAVSRENLLNLIPGVMDYLDNASPERLEELLSTLNVSGWEEVLDNYTDDVWGESLRSVTKLVEEHQAQQEKGNADRIRLDGPAISRLKMILGHVAEMTNLKNTSQQAPMLQHNSVQEVAQSQNSTGLAMNSLRHQPMERCATNIGYEHRSTEYSSSSHQQKTLNYKANESALNQHLASSSRPSPDQSNNDEQPALTFHCPWVRCHQVSPPGCLPESLLPMPI